jgi:hypothetical protein
VGCPLRLVPSVSGPLSWDSIPLRLSASSRSIQCDCQNRIVKCPLLRGGVLSDADDLGPSRRSWDRRHTPHWPSFPSCSPTTTFTPLRASEGQGGEAIGEHEDPRLDALNGPEAVLGQVADVVVGAMRS